MYLIGEHIAKANARAFCLFIAVNLFVPLKLAKFLKRYRL